MRINRFELIEKIKAMIAQREADAQARKDEAYGKAATAESEYVAEHQADWAAFANRIRAQIRKGRAVTKADVPEGLKTRGWAVVDLFDPPKVRESDYLPRTEALTRLIAVLESSPDEYISTSALDRIGAPLRELMRP